MSRGSRPAVRRAIAAIAIGGALAVTSFGGALAASPAPAVDASPAPVGEPSGCAQHVLDGLTLRQRVGQLFLLGIGAGADRSLRDAIAQNHFGSVTYAAFVPTGTQAIAAQAARIQALATDEATGGVGFLVAANQEGGRVQALSGPGFATMPSALEQGAMTPSRLREDAGRWGRELVAAGINLNLAPVADVVSLEDVTTNAPIGQLQREFGHTPKAVEVHARAFLEGMRDAGVLTSAKHFPGLGRVRGNTDFASGVHDTVTRPDDPFLRPFREAVTAGVPMVMASLASYEHLDGRTLAAFSRPILTGILREQMGFHGVVVSDDLSAVAVEAIPAGDRAIRFLEAGGDLVTVTVLTDARAMARALVAKAQAEPAFARRIDQSVLRILDAKGSAGLLPCG